MINNRIIHLINTPEDIRALDIENIQKMVIDYPYVQSFRVLYLMALNKFGSSQYQSELAITAAYTTDKKILYQLLNPVYKNLDISETKEIEHSQIIEDNFNKSLSDENISQNEEEIIEINSNEPESSIVPKIRIDISNGNAQEEKQSMVEDLETENILSNIEEKLNEEIKENITVTDAEITDWNPMNVHISTSDELIDQLVTQKNVERHDYIKEDVSIDIKKVEIKFPIKTSLKSIERTQTNSNVSLFINTWTDWLHKQKPKNSIDSDIDKKEAIINKFIETNPKIGNVKDNIDYIVKDKGENISHLMTETLAVLYLEQKIYTKAIDAFKILQEKYPDKSKDFRRKIKYIKDLQSGKIQPKDI